MGRGGPVILVNGKTKATLHGRPHGTLRLRIVNVANGRFVLERNGRPTGSDELANKDTVVVPMKSTLKLVARFDEPGMWMYHCHILEHAELGMMGEIHVQ